jgi:hypothetical protein
MRRLWLLMALLAPLSAHAQRASDVTGANLLTFCTASNSSRVQNCEAYLNGVADTFTGFLKFGPKDAQGRPIAAMICIPPAITGRDLRLSVIHGLQQQPALQSLQAVEAVERILHHTYPCH